MLSINGVFYVMLAIQLVLLIAFLTSILLRKPGSLVDVIYNFVVNAANPFRHSDKKKREKLLNEVLEGMDQAVVAFSAGNIHERKIIMTNSKLQEMMELPDEMVQHGLNHDEMLSFLEKRGDLSDLDLLKLEKFRSQPDFSEHMSLTYKLPSGRYAQSLGSKREDGTGRIVTFNDITDIVNSERERAALAENLAHMQRLKSVGQLTGGVAHDFNNLLAVISGNAELLRMEMDADNSYISEILQSVKRGAELTQRLLAFSRKQTLRPKPLDTSEMIGGLSTMLKRTLGDDVIVSVDEASNLWTCYADRSQIENAILNLAVNSRDAMPNGGSLRIHVSNKELFSDFCNRFPELVPGKYVKVTIEDNGVGIPEELLTKVYDPFFTTKDIGKGSGLGLSMVYGFIKQSNGHISITSSENSGTTVTLYLPTTQEPVRTEAPSLHLIRTSKNGQTIVVVEDNLSVQNFVVRALRGMGYQVRSFCSAMDALFGLQEDDTMDLLVTDIVLPGGMNGAELGRKLRAKNQDLKLLYMSGNIEDIKRIPTTLDPDIPVLNKPFSIEHLAQHLETEFGKEKASCINHETLNLSVAS